MGKQISTPRISVGTVGRREGRGLLVRVPRKE